MADQQKPSGLAVVRSTSVLIGAPGLAGFMNLLEPDTAFGECKFKLNIHHTDAQFARLGQQFDEYVVEPLWDKFQAEADKAKLKPPGGAWQKPNGDDWIAEHQKEPSEKSRVQQPFLIFANEAEYVDRKTGETKRKRMNAYDAAGQTIDLASLKLGMGSVIQSVLLPGLFANKLIKQPSFSFKLQGVKVLVLKQFGGSGGALGGLSEEDMALIGDGAEVDDLSEYAGVSSAVEKVRDLTGRRPQEELDDEIPF